MKEFIKSAFLWTAVICAVPAFMKSGEPAAPAQAAPPTLYLPADKVIVSHSDGSEDSVLTIEEYTVYAVLAQIPYVTDTEALKAQSVAARTYAARLILEEGGNAHISDDEEKYQICLTERQARLIYGEEYEQAAAAVTEAAALTEGEVLTYEGFPIIAAFHTSSSGQTESAENVWGEYIPYLTPAPSEEDPLSPYTVKSKAFTAAEICARIKQSFPDAGEFEGIEDISVTPSGTVISAELCGVSITGREIAEILTFDSAAFSCDFDGERAIFTVRGCGHLCGMSICGADNMAKNGADYREILKNYYSGAQVQEIAG